MHILAVICATMILAPAAPEAPPDPPTAPVRKEASPGHEIPPGTPAELETWERGVNATRLLHSSRDQATRLQHRAKGRGTLAALEAIAKGDASRRPSAEAAHARILAAGAAVVRMLKSPWPIDPLRGCSAQVIDYEAQLWNKDPKMRAAYMPNSERALLGCIAKSESVIKVMSQLNGELEAAILAGEKLAGTGPGATPVQAAKPSPETSP